MSTRNNPKIIQGGMGIGVSNWMLARAVAQCGQLGVVSGTAVDTVMVRRLQDGDPGGHMRRALEACPLVEASEFILRRFHIEGGREPDMPYRALPMFRRSIGIGRAQIAVVANFVEVWLAKEGHDGLVGINLLTKVQMPNLPSLYGAMLANVDYVLMGAGIPREIPGVLDAFQDHRAATLKLDVEGAADGSVEILSFDPRDHMQQLPADLRRPAFLPIVSASSLATSLARKASGRVDGFVVEGPTAGGHNAPPRGEPRFSAEGDLLYGERDIVDLEKIRALDLPFWLAGGAGTPAGLTDALATGAAGIQVGTLFAYCDESGLAPPLKTQVIASASGSRLRVKTDSLASPTGYPFKVVHVDGLEQQDDSRVRNCDLGYLRVPVRMPHGALAYRCAAEPVEQYVAKGGDAADTVGRRCLCNALTANIGQPQHRATGDELPLLTSGDELVMMDRFTRGRGSYSAADVIEYLMADFQRTPIAWS